MLCLLLNSVVSSLGIIKFGDGQDISSRVGINNEKLMTINLKKKKEVNLAYHIHTLNIIYIFMYLVCAVTYLKKWSGGL
jgi:hypothetical protein